MSTLINSLNALDAARPDYEEAETYYNGMADEVFTSTKLQRILNADSAEFSFNYARIVITSRLSRMEVSSITTQDGGYDDILAEIWNGNQLDLEVIDALEAALVYGDAYLIGEPNETGFNIFFNDPYNTRVFYEAENPRVKSHAIKRWMTEDGYQRVNLYFTDRIEKYISKAEGPVSSYAEGDFEPYEDEEGVWPAPNETGAIPVFHLRTTRLYGTPEHKQAYGPQNAINKLLATQIDSIDFSTAPQRYILQEAGMGNAPSASDFAAPGVVDDDDDTPTLGLEGGPGGVWNLKGAKSVGQFDAADPDVFVVPFKTYIEALGTVTQTPTHAFNVGALPSGESLRAAEAPLNKRVASLTRIFGSTLRELHEYALSTYGVNADVIVTWAPPATYDDADLWANVKAKTEAGVPMRVALMEAGYTDAQVSEWYPEGEPARPISETVKLADSMMKLSAAVTGGIITKEEARRALPQDFLSELPMLDTDSVIEALGNSNYPPEVNE